MLSVHLFGNLFFFIVQWKDGRTWIGVQIKPIITRWKPVSLQQKKNGELPHYINNTEVFQYMAGIAWTPMYLPVHVLRFESQNEKKFVMIRYLGWKYIKLFAFYKYLQQTTSVWKINLHIYEITYCG